MEVRPQALFGVASLRYYAVAPLEGSNLRGMSNSASAAVRGFTVLVIAILKGGARKTTSAMMLAFELSRRGIDVLVVDADPKTQGVTDWATQVYAAGGEMPFHVVQWAPSLGLLVPFALKAQKDTGAAVVIIDVGGEAPEVLTQAVAIADRVISPVGAERGELGRVPATAAVVDSAGVRMQMLLTKVPKPGEGASREARELLVGQLRREVLTTETPRNLDTYANVWGTIPETTGVYADLADELGLVA